MASWEEDHWESSVESGVPRSAMRSGTYRRYQPDTIDGVALAVNGDLSRRVAALERKIRALNGAGAENLAGIARFLLRSEAIASSRIEGISSSAQQVALAELGQFESIRGVSAQAQLVANNMTVVRQSTTDLVDADPLTIEHIVELHRGLLPEEKRHHGLRTDQNWIGGNDWNPIDADFVPPSPNEVPNLMQDLVDYINGSAHSPIIQAAVAHAQFETIHPFTDGNGRVGRALIHTVWARRGLTERAVLPVSLVLATLRDRYVSGLSAFRHEDPAGTIGANDAINDWMATFVDASEIAVEQSEKLVRQVEKLRLAWGERLANHRESLGLRPRPRADSAVIRLLDQLTEAPVVTSGTLSRILDVSYPAASAALEELEAAKIMTTRQIERGAKAYIAREVLDLITVTERALASTKFDTRTSNPIRPVPARPQN